MEKSRLHKLYKEEIRTDLLKTLGLKNIMEVPEIKKIVINVGVKEAVEDSKALQAVIDGVSKISGQRPVRTLAKKSIAGFKIREGMALGVKVTLRKERMYDFLDKFVNLALPSVRDFQGLKPTFDGRGNYNIGVKEWIIFPEIEFGAYDKIYGLNITIHTNAKSDAQALELLKKFNMPFRKDAKK
jgi:large subunit ribosomal protein L5